MQYQESSKDHLQFVFTSIIDQVNSKITKILVLEIKDFTCRTFSF